MKKHFIAIIVVLFLLSAPSMAGQLSEALASQIAARQGSESVRVWISLPRPESPQLLKSSVNASAATRQGRYRLAHNRLKSNHGASQKNLIAELNRLSQSGKCNNIKPSWLANVVEADIQVGELERLAGRTDVQVIYTVPQLTLIKPDSPGGNQSQQAPAVSVGVESNISFIKADQAWAAGYTGAGRIICSFDTGVDGIHPALINGWKGHDGDSAAAWFDPRDRESFPHSTLGDNHGTHVMGILVGHDDASGDTVGVALEAKWISAAVVDVRGASYIDAFEWAADPDGDPNSVDDVPDVVNHSWGFANTACQNVFFDFIDNLEALGIVNIFAAGNDGNAGSFTIRNPANRAKDSIDCFAVGNVSISSNPPLVSSSSSRGPSDCNGETKPNVCAPGTSIRSASLFTLYGFLNGTSVAAPHVSGLVALLRQKNPNATVDEIKTAILISTQRYLLPLPDNNYGWGVIDCMEALSALPTGSSSPNVRVYSYDHNLTLPGDTVAGTVVLQNLGTSVSPVSASITSVNQALTVLNGSAFFGSIATGDTVRSADSIRVVVADTVTEGSILSLDFQITNGSNYTKNTKLYFMVEPPTERSIVTHDIGRIDFSVTNFGTYGLGPGTFFPAGGVGFRLRSLSNDLYESGLLIATDVSHVSDGIRNAVGEPDGDFRVTPGGNIKINLPGAGTSQKTSARFYDSRAENPIGVGVRQFTYSFADPGLDNFVIMRYILTNNNTFTLNNVYAGLYLDWDVFPFSSNAGGYDGTSGIAWMGSNDGSTISRYRGSTILDGPPAAAYTDSGVEVYYPPSPNADGFTEFEKLNALMAGFGSATIHTDARTDLFQVISVGPLNIPAGQSEIVTFALLADSTFSGLNDAALAATNIYDTLLNTCCLNETGNIDGDPGNEVGVLDLTYLVDFIFRGGAAPVCMQEANLDGSSDGIPTVLDLTYIIDYIFRGGSLPIACPGF